MCEQKTPIKFSTAYGLRKICIGKIFFGDLGEMHRVVNVGHNQK